MNKEMRLFLALRWTLLRNAWRSMRERHTTGGAVAVPAMILLLLVALFFFFRTALMALGGGNSEFRLVIVTLLFAVFFLVMLGLLALSNAVFCFASLTRSWETDFLHATPMAPAAVFWHRLLEAETYSLWATFLLCFPLIAAFGQSMDAPWHFYLVCALLFTAFVSIAVTLGGIASVLFVNYVLPSRRRVAILAATLVAVFLFFSLGELVRQRWLTSTEDVTYWLEGPLAKLNMTQNAFLPSLWLTDGIMASAQGHLRDAIFSLCLLGGNALFFGMLAYLLAERAYLQAYQTAQDHVARHRFSGRRLVYIVAEALFSWTSRVERRIIIKDLKVFLRSPVQWTQVLVFLGILAIYFVNIQHFQKIGAALLTPSVCSLVNLISISLTLCTFTVRFAYPVISLEGANFWVLGMAPIKRSQIMDAKLIAVLSACLLSGLPLMLLSDLFLGVAKETTVLHVIALTIICLGLTALSVGLGARHLALQEINPAKIVAGLGGTVTLILSLAFVTAVLIGIALPHHVGAGGGWLTLVWDHRAVVAFGLVAGTIVLWLVMRGVGARALDRFED